MSVVPAREDGSRTPVRPATGVIVLLLVFEFVNGIMQGEITPLLPNIRTELNIGAADLNWIVSVELLAAAISVPVFGKLGDLYGHRRLLRVAIAFVAAGSVLIAVAPNLPLMLLGRVLQGAEPAIVALIIALCWDLLPPGRARSVVAWAAGTLPAGILVGAILVGGLAEPLHSVHWVLAVPAVLAVLCVPLSYIPLFPESRPQATGRVDWLGAVGLALAMALLLFAISQGEHHSWGSGRVLIPLIVALAVLAGWVLMERRIADPLVDPRMVLSRRMLPILLCSFIYGVFYFGNQAAGSTFLSADRHVTGYGFGLRAIGIAALSIPLVVAAVIGTIVVKRFAALVGGYRIATAIGFALVGLGYLLVLGWHTALGLFVIFYLIAGFGGGVALAGVPIMVAEAAPTSRLGIAMGLCMNFRTIGGALGSAVAASILSSYLLPHPGPHHTGQPTEHAFMVLWSIICALCFVGALIALLTRRTESAVPG